MVCIGSPPFTLQEGPGQIASGFFAWLALLFTIKSYIAIQITSVFNFKQCKGLLTRDINGRILKKEGDLNLII